MRFLALAGVLVAFVALPGGAGGASSCPVARFTGTAGNDHYEGTAGADSYDGQLGDDVIRGGAGDDCLSGGAGNDYIEGDKGADRLAGGPGADHLEGGFGRDTLIGGPGNDLIGGGQERSVIQAGRGDDRISSSNGVADVVDCGTGRDRVVADRSDHLSSCERVHYTLSPFPLVTPHSGRAGTTFTVYFRALYRAGGGHGQYVIGIVHSGDCRTGYSSLGRVSRAATAPGDTVRFVLQPGPHGGWCPGLFRGVAHWEGPGGKDIRLGRFFFRVRPS